MATEEKVLYASCIEQGTLELPTKDYVVNGFSQSGNLADYNFKTADSLHSIALNYAWVNRNGKKIKGNEYSLKMALNDFARFSD